MSGFRASDQMVESLRTVPLFSSVGDRDLDAIASLLIERRFPKNKIIVEEGLPGDYMYVIREGRVKVTKLSGDGREQILALLEAGDFFGEMALLEQAPRSATVRALTETRMLALSRRDFLHLLESSPDLAMAMIRELTRRLRRVDEQANSLSFQRVEERTKGVLVRLSREQLQGAHRGRFMTPQLTHQQIADMIGTSRETVTRVLKDLRADGWLEQDGKQYVVPSEAVSGG